MGYVRSAINTGAVRVSLQGSDGANSRLVESGRLAVGVAAILAIALQVGAITDFDVAARPSLEAASCLFDGRADSQVRSEAESKEGSGKSSELHNVCLNLE